VAAIAIYCLFEDLKVLVGNKVTKSIFNDLIRSIF